MTGGGTASGIGKHRIIVIEKFVNSAVDVQTGQKHTTTTNAYQALGKPFSFTPPLSATTIAPSKYNVLNLTSLLFLATAVWSVVLAVSANGFPASFATELRLLFALVAAGPWSAPTCFPRGGSGVLCWDLESQLSA